MPRGQPPGAATGRASSFAAFGRRASRRAGRGRSRPRSAGGVSGPRPGRERRSTCRRRWGRRRGRGDRSLATSRQPVPRPFQNAHWCSSPYSASLIGVVSPPGRSDSSSPLEYCGQAGWPSPAGCRRGRTRPSSAPSGPRAAAAPASAAGTAGSRCRSSATCRPAPSRGPRPTGSPGGRGSARGVAVVELVQVGRRQPRELLRQRLRARSRRCRRWSRCRSRSRRSRRPRCTGSGRRSRGTAASTASARAPNALRDEALVLGLAEAGEALGERSALVVVRADQHRHVGDAAGGQRGGRARAAARGRPRSGRRARVVRVVEQLAGRLRPQAGGGASPGRRSRRRWRTRCRSASAVGQRRADAAAALDRPPAGTARAPAASRAGRRPSSRRPTRRRWSRRCGRRRTPRCCGASSAAPPPGRAGRSRPTRRRRLRAQRGQAEEAEHAQPVVDRDDHDVVRRGHQGAVVLVAACRWSGRRRGSRTAPGASPRACPDRAVDAQVQAVLGLRARAVRVRELGARRRQRGRLAHAAPRRRPAAAAASAARRPAAPRRGSPRYSSTPPAVCPCTAPVRVWTISGSSAAAVWGTRPATAQSSRAPWRAKPLMQTLLRRSATPSAQCSTRGRRPRTSLRTGSRIVRARVE